MNTFVNTLSNETNFARTENGALTHKTTNSAVYDMFAFGGAYRSRSEADCIFLFKKAYEEDKNLALKCLFYLRDVRGGGQGERRFFRVCFHWLANNDSSVAEKLLEQISEYGRWDDLIYASINTKVESSMIAIVKKQLALDIQSKTPSLLAKWMPSENASSKTTKATANRIRNKIGWSHKQYRKILSDLRARINIVERLMSENRWDEIEFDKIPSKAGLIYKNAFARRDIIAKKYENFIKDDNTKVNANTLYPYEIVEKAIKLGGDYRYSYRYAPSDVDINNVDRLAINKYWANLPDYLEGNPCSMMCVVDTSGSMYGRPINVAISLGLYCAERIGEPFKNHYISFSSKPNFIKTDGIDFVDKVHRIYRTNLCENTNIEATFNLLKKAALDKNVKKEDIPKTLVIISDMEIDYMSYTNVRNSGMRRWTRETSATEMERIRADWEASGLECPKLVYWNVNARNDNILDAGPNVSFVSGCSPIIFKQVLTGVTGYELMMQTLLSERYATVEA